LYSSATAADSTWVQVSSTHKMTLLVITAQWKILANAETRLKKRMVRPRRNVAAKVSGQKTKQK